MPESEHKVARQLYPLDISVTQICDHLLSVKEREKLHLAFLLLPNSVLSVTHRLETGNVTFYPPSVHPCFSVSSVALIIKSLLLLTLIYSLWTPMHYQNTVLIQVYSYRSFVPMWTCWWLSTVYPYLYPSIYI